MVLCRLRTYAVVVVLVYMYIRPSNYEGNVEILSDKLIKQPIIMIHLYMEDMRPISNDIPNGNYTILNGRSYNKNLIFVITSNSGIWARCGWNFSICIKISLERISGTTIWKVMVNKQNFWRSRLLLSNSCINCTIQPYTITQSELRWS